MKSSPSIWHLLHNVKNFRDQSKAKKKNLWIGDFENSVFWVGHFNFYFSKKKFFASLPWKQVKVYWLARMDQAKHDNTFWHRPNILTGSVGGGSWGGRVW